MEGILSIFQTITENSNNSDLNIFLEAFDNHQSFRYNETNSSVVQNITNLLSQASTRYTGLHVLSTFLRQAPLEVINQKGALWTTLCLKECNSRDQSPSVSFAYDVVGQIIEKSIDIPDLMKAFTSHLLSKIFETLTNINTASQLSALKVIEISLKLYSGPCSQVRALIEKIIYSLVDSKDEAVIELCGRCLHLLQQTRGSGMQGVSFKSTWQTYQLSLLGSLHELLEIIFENCSEVYDEHAETERLKILALQLSDEPIYRSLQLFTRFKNLLTYLEIAIREPFVVSKCIMPKKIFNLLSRVLAVNCTILEKNAITDNLAIGALLPEMHRQCFKLLNTIILTLGSNLAMYHKTIINFIAETLKWTSFGKALGFRKPFSSLRISAYETLCLWCETMKHASECQLIEEILIEQIIFDVTPFHSEVTLKVLSGSRKYLSKKARRILHKAQNEKTHLVQAHSKSVDPQSTKKEFSDEGNQKLCAAALKCLKCILVSSSHNMKPVIIKEVQNKILELCIQLSEKDQTRKLYSNSECRRNLYSVMFSFVNSSHYLCPSPVQLIITLINHALIHDDCLLVREDCHLYMQNLESIIHPQKDNLNFPHDLNDIRKALKEYNSKRVFFSYDDNEISILNNERENNVNGVAQEQTVNENLEKITTKSTVEILEISNGKEDSENNMTQKINDKLISKINEKNLETVISASEDDMEKVLKRMKSNDAKTDVSIDIENVSTSSDEVVEVINLDEEPVFKKARLGNDEISHEKEHLQNNEIEINKNPCKDTCDNVDDNNLVEEIAKTFINELNEESC